MGCIIGDVEIFEGVERGNKSLKLFRRYWESKNDHWEIIFRGNGLEAYF